MLLIFSGITTSYRDLLGTKNCRCHPPAVAAPARTGSGVSWDSGAAESRRARRKRLTDEAKRTTPCSQNRSGPVYRLSQPLTGRRWHRQDNSLCSRQIASNQHLLHNLPYWSSSSTANRPPLVLLADGKPSRNFVVADEGRSGLQAGALPPFQLRCRYSGLGPLNAALTAVC